jgi:hypothetical protein
LAQRRPQESLRAFYQLGMQVLKSDPASIDPATGRRARGSFARLCEQTGRGRNELAKARKFARLYRGTKLDRICSLGKKRGRPLTKSHVCRLVVLSDSQLRDRLARQCANQRWSVVRLEFEIQRVQSKRPYGGRDLNKPKTLEEALIETWRMARRWNRWTDALMASGGETAKNRIRRRELLTQLWNVQQDITKQMRYLEARIQQAMKPHRKGRRKRSR